MELSVETDSETAEAVAEAFAKHGGRGSVVQQDNPIEGEAKVLVKTYIPVDDSLEAKCSDIDLVVRLLGLIRPIGPLNARLLAEEDWARAWRKHFNVLRVGQRVVICPSWTRYRPEPADVVVCLDPGMAFGTGLHPTTRLCLQLLERLLQQGMRVLDLGTGSGILSLTAVGLGATRVLALDIDPVAVKVARENVSANGATGFIQVQERSLGLDYPPRDSPFDMVVANITATPIIEMAEAIVGCLKPQGLVLISGILQGQVPVVERAFARHGARVEEVTSSEDWRALVLRKGGG